MNESKKQPSNTDISWNVRDLANLQLKYSESLGIHCASGFEAQADTSAAAIDQLITDIGGPEILRDHRIWQIIVGEEMDIRYGALYFSVHRTLAENTECLRQMLEPPLSEASSMTAEELFGSPEPETPSEETQVVRPKPPAPRGIQRWTHRAIFGGALLLTGVLGIRAYIILETYRTNATKHTEDPPLVPIKPSPSPEPLTEEFTDDCSIRFIPETNGYRADCDITEREGLKPILQFQKRGPEGERLGLHEADLSFSRKGKICISKRRLPVKPRTTTELPTETFMCAAPPPK